MNVKKSISIFFIYLFTTSCNTDEEIINHKMVELKDSNIIKYGTNIRSMFRRGDDFYVFYKDTTLVINKFGTNIKKYPFLNNKEVNDLSSFVTISNNLDLLKYSMHDSTWIFTSYIDSKNKYNIVFSKESNYKQKIQHSEMSTIISEEGHWFTFR